MKFQIHEPGVANRAEDSSFWKNALAWHGSITPRVIGRVLVAVAYSYVVTILFMGDPGVILELALVEVSGAVLGVLLVLRTNAGHDRWWEARKLWGGIVNQCRNLVIAALSYGPQDWVWKETLTHWVIAYAHISRRSLRGEKELSELKTLLDPQDIQLLSQSEHMPGFAAQRIGAILELARERGRLDGFSFLRIDRERATLIDHIGACERILKTPIPLVLAIKLRRFILVFLLLVPFVLIQKAGWFTPLVTFIVAYPLFALDQIGLELQNPFDPTHMSHLPLDTITSTIQKDLLAYLDQSKGERVSLREQSQRIEL